MKKPFLYAFTAAAYIVIVTLILNSTEHIAIPEKSFIMPILMLSLLVLSALIMGFLFLYEPLLLLVDNKKKEALAFFGKTIGFFAGFALLLVIIFFLL